MKVCLYDHHNYQIPTDGIGGVIGLFQHLYEGLRKENVDLTIIVNDKSPLESEENFTVIKLPMKEIENIKLGTVKVSKYFDGDIFYSNSSGRHVNFNFDGFNGKWVATCHGCYEFVGNADCQIFVSNNQLKQHFRDGLFDSFCNDYRVIHTAVDTNKYCWTEGSHDKIVWMGRIDGAKAERLYDIAMKVNQKIYAAGWYSSEFEWLFEKIMSTGNVVWLGEIKGDENKKKFYSTAKASIHCSTFEDPSPTTILEAQACGIPVISYANGSMIEICENKSYIFDDLNSFVNFINTNDFKTYENANKTISFVKNNFNSLEYHKKYLKIFKTL